MVSKRRARARRQRAWAAKVEGFVPGLGGEFGLTGGEKLIELGLIFVSEDAEGVDSISHLRLKCSGGVGRDPDD